jgi:hypothetical protein
VNVTSFRRIVGITCLVIACAAPTGVAHADEDETRVEDNVATAVIEQDAGRAFDFAWEIRREFGGIIDHVNAARAAARCTACDAEAIAFQIVLVTGWPTTLTPHNVAIAITDQCSGCQVYAGARQFVRVLSEQARFTGAGIATIEDVREDLEALEYANLDPLELQAEVDRQENRVLNVLLHELVPLDGNGRSNLMLGGMTLRTDDF